MLISGFIMAMRCFGVGFGYFKYLTIYLILLALTACGGGGGGGGEDEAEAETIFEAPILELTSAKENEVVINWDYNNQETLGYDIYVSLDSNVTTASSKLTAAASNAVNFIHNSSNLVNVLTADTIYFYAIRAKKPSGKYTILSNIISAKTSSSNVNSPTISTITSDIEIAIVNWDTVVGAEGYRIHSQLGTQEVKITDIISKNTTSHTVTSLSGGLEYSFEVSSISYNGLYVNKSNIKNYESNSPAKPATIKYPLFKPNAVSAVAQNSTPTIDVFWKKYDYVQESGSHIPPQSYKLYYSTTSSITKNTANSKAIAANDIQESNELENANFAGITGLNADTTYYVAMTMINPDGKESDLSSEFTVKTNEEQLAAPAGLTIAATNNSSGISELYISWDSLANASGYVVKIYDYLSDSTIYQNVTAPGTFLHIGTSENIKQDISLVALSASGFAGKSTAITTTTSLYNLVAPTTLGSITPSADKLTLTWDDVFYTINSTSGFKVEDYIVSRWSAENTTEATLLATYSVSGTSYEYSSTDYIKTYFTIASVNKNGNAGAKSPFVLSDSPWPSSLAAVANLETTFNPTDDNINISWDKLDGASSYVLYWTHSKNSFSAVDTNSASSMTISATTFAATTQMVFDQDIMLGGYKFAITGKHDPSGVKSTAVEKDVAAVIVPTEGLFFASHDKASNIATATISLNSENYTDKAGYTFALQVKDLDDVTTTATTDYKISNLTGTALNINGVTGTTEEIFSSTTVPASISLSYVPTPTPTAGATFTLTACYGIIISGSTYCKYKQVNYQVELSPPAVPTDAKINFDDSAINTYNATLAWDWAANGGTVADNFKIYTYNHPSNMTIAGTVTIINPSSAINLDSLASGWNNKSLIKSDTFYAISACDDNNCSEPATTTIKRGIAFTEGLAGTTNSGQQVIISDDGKKGVFLYEYNNNYHILTNTTTGEAEKATNGATVDLALSISTSGSVHIALSKSGDYLFVGNPASTEVKSYSWNINHWEDRFTITNSNINFGTTITLSDNAETIAVYSNGTSVNTDEKVSIYKIENDAVSTAVDVTLASTVSIGGTDVVGDIDGVSMSFFNNGTQLAISATRKDDTSLYLYKYENSTWISTSSNVTENNTGRFIIGGATLPATYQKHDGLPTFENGVIVSYPPVITKQSFLHARALYSNDGTGQQHKIEFTMDDDLASPWGFTIYDSIDIHGNVSKLATIQTVIFSSDDKSIYTIIAGDGELEVFALDFELLSSMKSEGKLYLFKELDYKQNGEHGRLGESISASDNMNKLLIGLPGYNGAAYY